MQAQLDFDNSLKGIKDFLGRCQRTSWATIGVAEAINVAIQEQGVDPKAVLTEASLEIVRQIIEDRGKNIDELVSNMFGGGRCHSRPFEERLQFIEGLQKQLKSGEKVNFHKALIEAKLG